ncbi:MAG: UDP-glucose 4-epimerase [Chlamydiales bacterium]|nr:UDP-glucose 4-epimerase [Chlamydiales bacterium]MCH9619520.1 UDP-glucose 4-epimerase [Chlamydiales bacterium]MCH9623126.1 UDP-glucose 4-epimerase [Chlamydiales bacterium]
MLVSMKKRILVTGGAGFVGSHLCEALFKQGHEVICVDNFYTGNRANISHLPIEIIDHDVCNPLSIEVDEIYNLACPASPIHYQNNPVQTTKTSVLGSLNLLELAHKHGAKILQASTSEVYGDPALHPQKESYWGNVNPVGIRACYDEGKRCSETLFFDYHRQYGTDICVVRIFNTYGPKMHPCDGRVVSNFIVQALEGKPLTIFGNGEQTRSFCYVDDLVAGLIAVMESSSVGPINLGNPSEFTMLELAHQVLALTHSTSKLIHHPLPEDDPKQRKPDITIAKSLGWSPSIALNEGLMQTIPYFQTLGVHA